MKKKLSKEATALRTFLGRNSAIFNMAGIERNILKAKNRPLFFLWYQSREPSTVDLELLYKRLGELRYSIGEFLTEIDRKDLLNHQTEIK
jgi:hypothetical protein